MGLDIEVMYRMYGHSVLRRARQILANDDEAGEVLQEIFVGLVARPGQFDGRSTPSTFLYAVTTHAYWVSSCAVTPDGRRVVSASSDQTLKVWDPESGRALATLEGHVGRVSVCAVTPDGRRVVSASWDQTLKVWDFKRGCA